MEKILAGDDIEIEVTLVNENNEPITISELEDIYIEICEGGCFSSTLMIAKEELAISGNVLTFVLSSSWTEKNSGRIFNINIIAVVDKTGNDQFPTGTMTRSTSLTDVFKIVDKC